MRGRCILLIFGCLICHAGGSALIAENQEPEKKRVITGRILWPDDWTIHETIEIRAIAEQDRSFFDRTSSNAQGEFQINGVNSNIALVALDKSKQLAGFARALPNENDVVVKLAPAVRLRGKLVWESGEPLKNHKVLAHSQLIENHATKIGFFGAVASTDEYGQYALSGLLPNVPYEISVSTVPVTDDSQFLRAHFYNLYWLDMPHGQLVKVNQVRLAESEGGHLEKVYGVKLGSKHSRESQQPANLALDAALQQAKETHHNVLLHFSGPGDGATYLYLQELLVISSKQLGGRIQILQLDTSQPGGQECMDRLRGGNRSFPWLAVLDESGKVIASGDRTLGPVVVPSLQRERNIGFPESPDSISHFLQMLRVAVPNVTDLELQPIAAVLGYSDITQVPNLEPNRNVVE